MGVCGGDDRDSRLDRLAHFGAREIESAGQTVRLERHACLGCHLEHRVQIEGVRRSVVHDASPWMAEASDGRMAHGLDDAFRDLVARLALAGMKAELHPVELREHLVGEVEEPSGRMSTSLPRRIWNGASCSLAAAISSPWRRTASASRPGTTRTACVWSQIAMYS